MSDDVDKSLRGLKGDAVKAQIYSSPDELRALIQAIGGPRTAASIRKAMKTYSRDRIPFLFSSLDPQLVVNVMDNDVDPLIAEILAQKKAGKSRP
ncbi:MAG: hypothetical protein EOP07_24280 [Proteobacteria bacterium]|nr:MAG: hypothetical protein EOP07_24280 [Pseudomonadota bacterium]